MIEFAESSPDHTITTRLVEVGIQSEINKARLDSISANLRVQIVEMEGHRLGIMIRSYVHGMGEEVKVISYPKTWWDAFKERFNLCRRFPSKWIKSIEYTVERITIYDKICPHLSMKLRDETDYFCIAWLAGDSHEGHIPVPKPTGVQTHHPDWRCRCLSSGTGCNRWQSGETIFCNTCCMEREHGFPV